MKAEGLLEGGLVFSIGWYLVWFRRESKKFEVELARGFSFAERLNCRYWLAYSTGAKDSGVWLVRADGSEKRKVFDPGDRRVSCSLAWDSAGRTLYFSHDQIYAIDVAGGGARAVTSFSDDDKFSVHWHLECSPDNRRLLFLQSVRYGRLMASFQHQLASQASAPARWKHRVCTIGANGENFRVILEDSPEKRLWQLDCDWEHNLLVATMLAGHPRSELWRTDLDGQNSAVITSLPRVATWPVISPDGEFVVYSGRDGVHVVRIASGERESIASFGSHPVWSPDGQRIAFVNEDYELWLGKLDGARLEKLLCVKGPNPSVRARKWGYACAPAWSADGRLLWFGITKTRRLRKPKDPAYVEKLKRDELVHVPADRREHYRKQAIEQAHWDCAHKLGIVDFIERKAWLADGYWLDVAWSPANSGASA